MDAKSNKNPSIQPATQDGHIKKEIEFEISEPGEIRLLIFNAVGHTVYQWTGYAFKPGAMSVTWNANDNKGNTLPSGTYSYLLQSPDGNLEGKIIL